VHQGLTWRAALALGFAALPVALFGIGATGTATSAAPGKVSLAPIEGGAVEVLERASTGDGSVTVVVNPETQVVGTASVDTPLHALGIAAGKSRATKAEDVLDRYGELFGLSDPASELGEAEAEYEAAQRYVRFARATYANAARAPRNAPPRAIARAATVTAARRHAPGLLRDRGDGRGRGGGRSQGGWGRRRDHRRGPGRYPGAVYPTYAWGGPWVVAGNDGYTWPGYAAPGWAPAGGPEPAPYEPVDGPGPDTDQETAGSAPTGQWVRHGRRIVVLGA